MTSRQPTNAPPSTESSSANRPSLVPRFFPFSSSTAVPSATESSPEPLWSEALQSTLDQPPATFSKRLLLGGLIFGCIFGSWAWFGHVQEVSHAQGQLVPEGRVYKIQPMTQGEVAQILVDEGDAVITGQVIATLDTQLEQNEIERLKQTLASYQAQFMQMQALIERTWLEGELRRAIATADVNAQQVAITETEVDIHTLQQMLIHLHAETNAYNERLQRLQPLVEAGAIAEDQLFQVEQSIREQQQAMTQNAGSLEKTQAESNRLYVQLQRQQAEGQRSQVELQQRLQELEREATDVNARIKETETLLEAAQTKLDQMYIYAPCDGVVLSLDVENTGEVVQAGQTIAEVAPDSAPLVLSAMLPSREAGLVEAGMEVNIKLDAFPYQDYGIVIGEVLSISPGAKTSEQLGAVYEVDISLVQDYVLHENQKVELQAGQTAQAEIVVRKKRIIDLLLDPIRQLQSGGISL